MIVNYNNKIHKFLSLTKQNKSYKFLDFEATHAIIELPDSIDPERIGETMIAFVENKKLCGDIVTLAGINPKTFMDLIKKIMNQNGNLRLFCNSTFQEFMFKRVEKIKMNWLESLKSEIGILLIDKIYWIYSVQHDSKRTISVELFHAINSKTFSSVNAHASATFDTETFEVIVKSDRHVNMDDRKKRLSIQEAQPSIIQNLLRILFFLQYAEVETKIVNNKTGKQKIGGEKFVNQTDLNVEVINSNYYTNIMRTESFGVMGHFRWQPKGAGRIDRELIWIKDFKKNGYQRKAKILTQSENG